MGRRQARLDVSSVEEGVRDCGRDGPQRCMKRQSGRASTQRDAADEEIMVLVRHGSVPSARRRRHAMSCSCWEFLGDGRYGVSEQQLGMGVKHDAGSGCRGVSTFVVGPMSQQQRRHCGHPPGHTDPAGTSGIRAGFPRESISGATATSSPRLQRHEFSTTDSTTWSPPRVQHHGQHHVVTIASSAPRGRHREFSTTDSGTRYPHGGLIT
ncbi:unnamed protein product [Lampetra fluviatilis]